jgi:hypothetical protein
MYAQFPIHSELYKAPNTVPDLPSSSNGEVAVASVQGVNAAVPLVPVYGALGVYLQAPHGPLSASAAYNEPTSDVDGVKTLSDGTLTYNAAIASQTDMNATVTVDGMDKDIPYLSMTLYRSTDNLSLPAPKSAGTGNVPSASIASASASASAASASPAPANSDAKLPSTIHTSPATSTSPTPISASAPTSTPTATPTATPTPVTPPSSQPIRAQPDRNSTDEDWNEEWQYLYEMVVNTPLDSTERRRRLESCITRFLNVCTPIVQTIVRELSITDPKLKTIQPLTQQIGVAGGLKFLHSNIFFK